MADPALKVLLIEDDEIVADMYRLRLVADGHAVVVGRNGEEGLRMASEEEPDFIFLDLRLPKIPGIEVLARMRADPKTRDIPVIILSNVDDPEMLGRRSALGVLEFMIKADTTPTQLSMRVAEHARRLAQPTD